MKFKTMGTTTITPIATSAKMMANTVNVSDTALSQIKLRDGGFARHRKKSGQALVCVAIN
jgi:hypothetical protein